MSTIRTRKGYAERVLNEVYPTRGRDEKIDIREVYLVLDQMVNEYAKLGYLENMRMGYNGVDEQFITTFENISVTDPANGTPSYFVSPANYVNLPNNEGIVDVYFMNTFSALKKKYFDPIIITTFANNRGYRKSMANNLEGRLSVYPMGANIVFDRGNINTTYGTVGARLVIRRAEDITDDAPYPVAGDLENKLISTCVEWFKSRRGTPVDLIKDGNDKP